MQSGANIADQPSRGDVSLLLSMGSLPFDMELPPVGGDWAAIYEVLFTTLAPRPSHGVKRARREIEDEVEKIKVRRP